MEFKHSDNKVWLEDEDGKEVAVIDFPDVEEGIVNIIHTEVDGSLQGQGIASKITQEAVEVLRNTNRKAILSCSYAIRWFAKHEDAQDVLADKEQARKQAEELAGATCGIRQK